MSNTNQDFVVEETEELFEPNSASFDELSDLSDKLGPLNVEKCSELLSAAAILADNAEEDDYVYVNLAATIATPAGVVKFNVNTTPQSKVSAVTDAVKNLFKKQ